MIVVDAGAGGTEQSKGDGAAIAVSTQEVFGGEGAAVAQDEESSQQREQEQRADVGDESPIEGKAQEDGPPQILPLPTQSRGRGHLSIQLSHTGAVHIGPVSGNVCCCLVVVVSQRAVGMALQEKRNERVMS